MEVSSSPAGARNGVALSSLPTLDPTQLVEHLVSVVGSTLGASREELQKPGNLLHESRVNDTTQRCLRFATDTQQHLYVQKDVAPEPVLESPAEECGRFAECLTLQFVSVADP